MKSGELGRYRGTKRCETSSEAGEIGYISISLHGHAEKRELNSIEISP